METKQIQTNVFTDGLNTDLHPLTTPNTVLTDCVNGTIITYNGNEYILQNDMGNYQLSKAKLPADYIPIGIKEYGNIVYIVSYNPLDKKCQIGSYPSPQTLFDSSKHESKNAQYQGIDIPEFVEKWEWAGDKSVKYKDTNNVEHIRTDVFFTDLKSKTNIIILFPKSDDNKDTFLNPGDKYYIQVDDQSETWKFQRCDYYTLTESKEVIKIKDDLININQSSFSGNFYNVRWETPGWIGYKPTLLEPISFDLYLTNLQSPTFVVTNQKDDLPETNLKVSAQGQLIVDANKWEQYYDNIRVYFYCNLKMENDSTDGHNLNTYAELSSIINCGNKTDILTYNAEFSYENVNKAYKLTIIATPYIVEDTQGFIYDNLSTTYTIDSDTISKISDIQCFDIYKYLINDEGVTLNFTIESPISKIGELTCRYRIWAFDDGMQNVHLVTNDFKEIDSLNMFGQNILSINWNGEFQKEEIYLFELAFGNLENNSFTPIYQNVQVLITSELLNDFYSTTNQFQDLSLSEWTANISKYVKIPDLDNDLTETQMQNYDWAVNVNNIGQLFSAKFYENTTNQLGGAYTAADELAQNVIDQDRHRIAGYYGMVSAVCGRLKYTMLPPEILDGKGIWANVKWENVTESDVITHINDEKFTNHYISSNNLFDKVAIVDYSAKITHAQYYLYNFMTHRYDGIITKKWYLYNNLLYGLPLFAQNGYKVPWDITEILLNSENNIEYSWTKEDLTNLTKNAQHTQMYNYEPYMWKIWQTSVYGKREKGYFKKFWKNQPADETNETETNKITIDERFFTFDFNDTKDEPNNDIHWPNATKFDKLIMSKESNPWWGIPIWIKTNNFKDNKYKNLKTWHFSDGTDIEHYNGHCDNCAFLAIPCNNETYTSLAVIKFFDNTPQKENLTDPKNAFFGTFSTNNKEWNSSWLVNPNAVGYQAIPNLYQDQNKSQYMSQMIAILFFALGIHLYGVYKTDDTSEQIISMEDRNMVFGNSSQEITVNYTRNDILNQVKYKNIDLTNRQNSWIVSNDILKTIIGEDYQKKDYNISTTPNNLSSGYIATNNIIKTKKASYYTINSKLSDLAKESSNFVTVLDNKLRDKIKEITASSVLLDKVYVDDNVATLDTLDNIASMLKFKWENNCGKFYYNDLPEATIGIRTEDDNGDNFIRSLDWSKIINWDSLYTALVPSKDFQANELKNKNGNN